jgi:archaellum component FlaC
MTLEGIKQKENEKIEKWYNQEQATFIKNGNGEDVEDAFNKFCKLLIIKKEKQLQIIHSKYEQLKTTIKATIKTIRKSK